MSYGTQNNKQQTTQYEHQTMQQMMNELEDEDDNKHNAFQSNQLRMEIE